MDRALPILPSDPPDTPIDSSTQATKPYCSSQSAHRADRTTCRPDRVARPGRRLSASYRTIHVLVPVALLVGCASLLVGADVIETYLFPLMSVGWHHTLLTLRAGVVTAVGCSIVFLLMRRHQLRLARTAEHLSSLLESYKAHAASAGRFENPHLVHCREVLHCDRTLCPMYDAPQERCWQVVALTGASRGDSAPAVNIGQCHECDVYRASCPDELSKLGESFNSLMFMLEEEAGQMGRMRSQLVEKEKMVAIGQMASGIAHEVGNPLSSISSVVQMLKRNRNGKPAGEQLDLIQTHIRRISTTVRQLVSLARPSLGGWTQVDVGLILDETTQLIGFDRRAHHVTIKRHISPSLPLTFGMKGRLEQVFLNLGLNALDAMPNGGTLTMRAESRGQDIVVRVTDTGTGIPPELGRRIFEPFFTTKEAGHGTGLGLSVSYGIIQEHEGSIDFRSQPEQGTEFVVTIPLLDQAPDE